ncbi:MAG: excisionase [Clostridia bacterium]|nr:excisionase [Clostridia bacterium]
MARTGRQTTEYTLMHKNRPVAAIELDNRGVITSVHDLLDPDHLPLAIPCPGGVPDAESLNLWWQCRGIPASRQGVRTLRAALNLHTTPPLLKRSLGLSLTDQYWIRPAGSGLSWEDANFFTNPFSEDIGDLLFGRLSKGKKDISFSSPDITCNGNLKKRWRVEDGKRYLIKAGGEYGCQEPVNDLMASRIAGLLNIPHVQYSIYWYDGLPYSACEDFISADKEFIPAYPILETCKRQDRCHPYDFFLNCCISLGIPDPRPFLDRMIVFDYIIANEDRHYENFGFIRDDDTLEWIGPAPLYDNGYSFGANKSGYVIRHQKPRSMPFLNNPDIQLQLVSDYSWLDIKALDEIPAIIDGTFAGLPAGFMSADRRDAILDTARDRLNYLKSHII